MNKLSDYITTKNAAELIGIDQSQVRRLCKTKKLQCLKLGSEWLVHRKSAECYIRSNSGPKRKDE